jgi:hypothetical protein
MKPSAPRAAVDFLNRATFGEQCQITPDRFRRYLKVHCQRIYGDFTVAFHQFDYASLTLSGLHAKVPNRPSSPALIGRLALICVAKIDHVNR